MGTNNLYENGPNPFFIREQKYGQADSYGNKKNIRKWTKSVFFIRSSTVSSSTTSPVKRRHQLMLRFYSCSNIVAQPGKNALL